MKKLEDKNKANKARKAWCQSISVEAFTKAQKLNEVTEDAEFEVVEPKESEISKKIFSYENLEAKEGEVKRVGLPVWDKEKKLWVYQVERIPAQPLHISFDFNQGEQPFIVLTDEQKEKLILGNWSKR